MSKIKDLIASKRKIVKTTKNEKSEKLNEFNSLLYDNPKEFCEKLHEIKSELKLEKHLINEMGDSLLKGYFQALRHFELEKNTFNYDILNQNYLKFIECFLDKINIQDNLGDTLLHFLAKLGFYEQIKGILRAFRNSDIKIIQNKSGELFYNISSRKENNEMQKIFSEFFGILKNQPEENFQKIHKKIENKENQKILKKFFSKNHLENFHNELSSLGFEEILNLLCYQDNNLLYILRNYVNLKNNEQLSKILQIIESKFSHTQISEFIKNFNNDICYIFRNGCLDSLNIILDFINKYAISINSEILKESGNSKTNIFHSIGQNLQLLNNERILLIDRILEIFGDSTYKLFSIPDNYGDLPFSKFLTNGKILSEVNSNVLLDKIKSLTDFNSKVTKKSKIILNPIQNLFLCQNTSEFNKLLKYLIENNFDDFFEINIYKKKSILDLILEMKLTPKTPSPETFQLILDSLKSKYNENKILFFESLIKNIHFFKKKSKTFCHIDSLFILVDFTQTEPDSSTIEFLADSLKEVFSRNKNSKFQKQHKDCSLKIKDPNYYVSKDIVNADAIKNLVSFLENLDSINSNKCIEKRDCDQLELILQKLIEKISKKPNEKPSSENKKENTYRNENTRLNNIFRSFFSQKIFNFLNKISDKNFTTLLETFVEIVLPFGFFSLAKIFLENLNSEKAALFISYIKEKQVIKKKIYESNSPVFQLEKVRNFYNFISDYDKNKNFEKFCEIFKMTIDSSVILELIFNILFLKRMKIYLKKLNGIYKIQSSSLLDDDHPKKRKLNVVKSKNYYSNNYKIFSKFFKQFAIYLGINFESTKMDIHKEFQLFSIFILNNSTNTQLIEILKKIIEYSHLYKDTDFIKNYEGTPKLYFYQESNLERNEKIYEELKLNEKIISDLNMIDSISTQKQISAFLLKSNKLFFEGFFIHSTFSWLKSISLRKTHIVNHFFDLSLRTYYMNSQDYIENKLMFVMRFYLDTILPFFNEKSGKLKNSLREKDQILLLKNFIVNFKACSSNENIQTVINAIRIRMSQFLKGKFNSIELAKNFIRMKEIHFLYAFNQDIRINLENLMTNFIANQTKQGIDLDEILRYSPFSILRIINSETAIFTSRSNLVNINIFLFLFNDSVYRKKENVINEIRYISNEIALKKDSNYLFSDSSKYIFNEYFSFNTFFQNLENYNGLINELLDINDYFRFSFNVVIYYFLENTNFYFFRKNHDKFLVLLELIFNSKLLNFKDTYSLRIFQKMISYSWKLSQKFEINIQENNLDLIIKGTSTLINSLKHGYFEFKSIINLLCSLLLKLISLKNLRQLENYIKIIISIENQHLKEILKNKNIKSVILLYATFTDNLVILKNIEKYLVKGYINEIFDLRENYSFYRLQRNNDFVKFVLENFNSTLLNLAILKNSVQILSHYELEFSLRNQIDLFILNGNYRTLKTSLNHVILKRKDKLLIKEYREILNSDEEEAIIVSKFYNNENEFLILPEGYVESIFFIAIKYSIINQNNILFEYLTKKDSKLTNQLLTFKNFEENTHDYMQPNIVHFLVLNKNYKIYLYLKTIIKDEIKEKLLNQIYFGVNPLLLSIKMRSYEMFCLLYNEYPSIKVFNMLVSNKDFAYNLINTFKKKEFFDFVSNYCPSFLNYISLFEFLNGIFHKLNLNQPNSKFKNVEQNFLKNLKIKSPDSFCEDYNKDQETEDVTIESPFINQLSQDINEDFIKNIVQNLIFFEKYQLDSSFFDLLVFDVTLSRTFLYLCMNLFNIFPNESLLSSLFSSDKVHKDVIFDIFFYFEINGFEFFKMTDFYKEKHKESALLKLNLASLNLNDFIIERKNKAIKEYELNIFEKCKNEFKKNQISLLENQFQNIDLQIMIYLDNQCKFNFDYEELIKSNLNSLFNYYFNGFTFISQQLLSNKIIIDNSNLFENIDNNYSNYLMAMMHISEKIYSEENKNNDDIINEESKNDHYDYIYLMISPYITFNYFIRGKVMDILKKDKSTFDIIDIFLALRKIFIDIINDKNGYFQYFFENFHDKINYTKNIMHDGDEIFEFILEKYCFHDSPGFNFTEKSINCIKSIYNSMKTRILNSEVNYTAKITNVNFKKFIDDFINLLHILISIGNFISEIRQLNGNFEIIHTDDIDKIIAQNNENIFANESEFVISIPIKLDPEYLNIVDCFYNYKVPDAIDVILENYKEIRSHIQFDRTFEKSFLKQRDSFFKFVGSDEEEFYLKTINKIEGKINSLKLEAFYLNSCIEFEFYGSSYWEKIINYLNINSGLCINKNQVGKYPNLLDSRQHFERNVFLTEDLKKFLVNYENYEVENLECLTGNIYKNPSYNVMGNNRTEFLFFKSNKKFNDYFKLVVNRLNFLRLFNMKFQEFSPKINFLQLENLIRDFLEKNEKLNAFLKFEDVCGIVYLKKSHLSLILDYLFEFILYRDVKLTNKISVEFKKVEQSQANNEIPSNAHKNLNLFEKYFSIIGINFCIQAQDNLTITINLAFDSIEDNGDLFDFIKKSSNFSDIKEDLVKKYEKNEKLREELKSIVSGIIHLNEQ